MDKNNLLNRTLRTAAKMLVLCAMYLLPAAAFAANGFFGGGDGFSAGTPFLIEDAADLNAVHNNLSAYYRLANDIDLTDYLATGDGFTAWGGAG